jgi:hypothetical protein
MVKGVNDFGKDFVGHFVQVGDGNAGCQDGAIGMLRGKGCRRLSGKSTQKKGVVYIYDESVRVSQRQKVGERGAWLVGNQWRCYLFVIERDTYSSSSVVVTPG